MQIETNVLLALLGSGATSDLGLQNVPKPTLTNRCSPISIYAYAA